MTYVNASLFMSMCCSLTIIRQFIQTGEQTHNAILSMAASSTVVPSGGTAPSTFAFCKYVINPPAADTYSTRLHQSIHLAHYSWTYSGRSINIDIAPQLDQTQPHFPHSCPTLLLITIRVRHLVIRTWRRHLSSYDRGGAVGKTNGGEGVSRGAGVVRPKRLERGLARPLRAYKSTASQRGGRRVRKSRER